MKLKLLLFLMVMSGIIHAQVVCDYPEGVNRSLVITEIRHTSERDTYLEITNMSDKPVRLSEYKLGNLTPYHSVLDLCGPWNASYDGYIFLPDKMLDPGKSFVISPAYDYNPIHFKEGLGRNGGNVRPKQPEIYEIADKLLHKSEPILLPDGTTYRSDRDSVTTSLNDPENLKGRGDYGYFFYTDPTGGTKYIEHHYIEGDSAVVDQIGGVFDDNGHNFPWTDYDVAGVSGAMGNSIIIRKAIVKNGNVDFANARGISINDSEWLPVQLPSGYDNYRDIWWTIGNHGAFVLDENTLEPLTDAVNVDYSGKKITVPWGTRRLDDIMRMMKRKPGIAWQYDLNPIQEDSLFRSARTGDKLTVYVFGNTLQSAVFNIEVKEPTSDDNFVIPVDRKIARSPGQYGPVTNATQSGILSWPQVTRHENGIDTITGYGFGLPNDLRTDTLLKYLEKPANASWEFEWIDGIKRPDLKNGDKLKVISESGKIKDYFIQIQPYNLSRNADLSSITWPDIPDVYKGIFGWKGDTIPNFSSGITQYRVEVPFDVDEIPSLKAKTSHVNAFVKVTRAKSLKGTVEDRTISFEVTAENDTVKKTYSVELIKEKTPDKIEPFYADPIISEIIVSYPGNSVNFLEIANPGNQSLDLKDYMIGYMQTDDLYGVIKWSVSWNNRYVMYIPGMKYVDAETWSMAPRMLVPDPNVNSIIPGGGTFVLAGIERGNTFYKGIEDYFPPYDVQFYNNVVPGHPNPWNENVPQGRTPLYYNGLRKQSLFLYKILNDSIKRGLKPNNDPNDFKVIDVFGMANRDAYMIIGGVSLGVNAAGYKFIRKPEITSGNPVLEASFGNMNPDSLEWIFYRPANEFGHIPRPEQYEVAYASLNSHFVDAVSYYKSTIISSVYKVSDGFGPDEEIQGVKTGTIVQEFLNNIYKEDAGQTLRVTAAGDGSELGMDSPVNMNDKLVVVSADGSNTTVYRLDVTEAGLSNNAYLTSTRWNINVSVDPKSAVESMAEEGIGSIAGFTYGTFIQTVIDNVNIPVGATLTVIDGNGAYVPSKILNFDTTYVDVTVNSNIFFDVVAEDNVTRIVYQLQPNTSENDAFILSDLYEVSQLDNLIQYVPKGTNYIAFFANVIPSFGASVKLVDKMGFERTQGNIREDDKVVVTSANGQTTRIYFISFLATSTIPKTTYLAYVLSEAYYINQVEYVIAEGLAPLTSETLLDEFLGYLTPSMGATVSVVDKNGEVKTSGDLNDGDKLVVTSADGKIAVTYTLDLDLTSAGQAGIRQQIEIYPNPASDKLQISGIEAGNRIQIYSANGALIHEKMAQNTLEVLSLDDVPSGIFMIVISDNNRMLGRFKAIKN